MKRPWTLDEVALLGTASNTEIAARLGRHVAIVCSRTFLLVLLGDRYGWMSGKNRNLLTNFRNQIPHAKRGGHFGSHKHHKTMITSRSRAIALALVMICCQFALIGADLVKPRIEVFKAKRELQLYDGKQLVKTYRVALGTNPVPPKKRQGDRATPEGSYFICRKNPNSQYHLSLGISYPGPEDARLGLKSGLISKLECKAILDADGKRKTPPWNTKLGGEVFVHGNGSKPDWTWGCIALDDSDIEELYRLVPVNTPITIHH